MLQHFTRSNLIPMAAQMLMSNMAVCEIRSACLNGKIVKNKTRIKKNNKMQKSQK